MSSSSYIRRSDRSIKASFEFFPPKTEKMAETLWESIERLAPLNPGFVSVTYGAGGSTRERTHSIVKRIQDEAKIPAAAHLTCVDASRSEVDEVIQSYWDAGIRHIVALRGDPATGIGTQYVPHADGYHYASDLVEGIRKIGDFEVSVAAYPEKHPEAPDFYAEIENLKRKIDAGATRAITQFFSEAEAYLRFLERVRDAGITIPIVPGIMPVTNFKGYATMSQKTGVRVPDWLAYRFEGLDEDVQTRKLVGAVVAAEMCESLFHEGIDQFHFYTLNRSDLTFAICHILGLRPSEEKGEAAA